MKKISYLFALVAICLCFVQCETNKIGQNGTHEGHEYVDLGLSVKWATCNVGATKPEEYGNYYAWGETTTKSSYTEENCRTFGVSMNDISGNATYDAARANIGGSARMPTASEIDELRLNCIWEWTTQNGVIGILGTSRMEGYTDRTIFFPTAGMFWMDVMANAEGSEWGWYWSKSVDLNDPSSAQMLLFQTLKLSHKNPNFQQF